MSIDTLHLDHRLVLQHLPSRRAPPTLDHHAPPTASHDSYEGVAGQNLVLLNPLPSPLAPVAGARSTERLQERRPTTQKLQGKQARILSWRALKSAGCLLPSSCPAPHLAARVRCHPDALPPGSEGVSPLPSCELVEGTTIISCFSPFLVRACGCQRRLRVQRESITEFALIPATYCHEL